MVAVEQYLEKLESEGKALDVSFERDASIIPFTTKSGSHTTAENKYTYTFTSAKGGSSFSVDGYERTLVTFDTIDGSNTLATLEIDILNSSNSGTWPMVRRIPYSGGARWLVTITPNLDANYNRIPTNINFSVNSMAPGTLTIGDMSS